MERVFHVVYRVEVPNSQFLISHVLYSDCAAQGKEYEFKRWIKLNARTLKLSHLPTFQQKTK